MKKLLIYVNSMNSSGGIERVISNLANKWSEKYKVTIVTKDNKKPFYSINNLVKIDSLYCPLNVDMNNRLQRIFAVFSNLLKIRKILKYYLEKNYVDYIYVATPLNAFEVYLLGEKYRKKLVVSEHASKFACNKIYQLMRKYVYPRIYCLSVPTIMDTKLYKKEGCNVIYIPHLNTFKVKEKNPLNTKLALSIGRFTLDKQQILLLHMWRNLYKEDKLDGWKLLLVGKGEEKSNIVDFIKNNSLEDCVSIINPIQDVDKIYKKADLFLFTSKAEGFGMVLLEAMSFGVPCISFDCPSGPRDIIKQGENGYLVPCFNKIEYEKRINELISNRQRLKDMGIKAYETVKNWNNVKIVQKWYNIFY